MDKVTLSIGRTSGPMNDREVESEFTTDQIELVKDVLAIVNRASNDREQWFVVMPNGEVVVPVLK